MTDYGDAEAATADILRADPALIAFGNVTVSTNLIGYVAGGRWIRVERNGGIPADWIRVDNPKIGFEVRAEDKKTARDLAAAARSAVVDARGWTGRGLILFDATDDIGLTWAPDPRQPAAARYTFTLNLVTRPSG